jgi:anti-sigma regulatory factor (Ser/Thr protein kinase)
MTWMWTSCEIRKNLACRTSGPLRWGTANVVYCASMSTPLPVQLVGRREFILEAHPASVSEARQHMADLAEPLLEESRMGDLQLVLSEVVSNAVRHGSPAAPIKLAITPKAQFLCVQVTDSGSGLAPRPRATVPDEHGGWGFFLIEYLTRRWGMTREDARTRVWFEFDF